MRLVDIDELKKHDHWRKTGDDLRCAPMGTRETNDGG